MAIATYNPETVDNLLPAVPKSEPKNYKSIVYDDRGNVPLHSLMAYSSGKPWTVNYYRQVVSEHNDLREIDPGQDTIYQQYELIKDLEIRVGSDLGSSYDSETGITSSTGDAIIYPFLIPNVSDYFISDAGDDYKGIFKITNVERKTFNRDSVFSIEYEMVGYAEVLTDLITDLGSKVIRTYHFSKDRLLEGLSPTLNSDVHQKLLNLKTIYKNTASYYFSTFFNRKYMTMVVPGQEYGIYDSFLVEYLFKTIDLFFIPEAKFIKQIPTDNETYLSQPQFWKAMIQRDYSVLSYCNQEMALVSKVLFNGNSKLHGLAYSNVDLIVYPSSPDLTLKMSRSPGAKLTSFLEIEEVTNRGGTLADLIDDCYITPNSTIRLIKTVNHDSYYVLSEAFYKDTTNKSVLEILVTDYLNARTLDIDKLLALSIKCKTWGRLEQFYYIPLLLTLIQEADRASY
jgi:hypothetical protein